METVTVAASRGSVALSGMSLMVWTVVILAVVAFAVATGLKHFRDK
ncbi:MAG TPA: hypothetical protein VGO53_00510 [Steroidobacteraceae bacterium]|nr:hypothetical protein [Steroidobacteraceae bacterium]